MSLQEQHVEPVVPGKSVLAPSEALDLARELPDWNMKWDVLERDYKFADFKQAVDFVNKVADVAEQENHHPDIAINYNKVHLQLSTHEVGGLTRNDFIVAAKISQLA